MATGESVERNIIMLIWPLRAIRNWQAGWKFHGLEVCSETEIAGDGAAPGTLAI